MIPEASTFGGEPLEFATQWGVIRALAFGPPEAEPVVAVHGWLDNAASFSLLAALMPDVRLVAIDLAGHGLSDSRPVGVRYHAVDNVDDVVAVIDGLGVESCTLVGHSMGAGIAPCVAAIDSRVRRLVMIEGLGPLSNGPEEVVATLRRAVADMKRAGQSTLPVYETVDVAVKARMNALGHISVEAAQRLCSRGLKPTKGGVTWNTDPRLRMTSALRFAESFVQSVLVAIEVPVQVILGIDSPFKVESHHAQRLARVPSAELIRLPGNHHLHLEPTTAPAVADAIKAFLQR